MGGCASRDALLLASAAVCSSHAYRPGQQARLAWRPPQANRPLYQRWPRHNLPLPPARQTAQDTLRTSPVGAWFFGQIANTKGEPPCRATACFSTRSLCTLCKLCHRWLSCSRPAATRCHPPHPAKLCNTCSAAGVRQVLQQCYGDPAAVDDELVDIILNPGLQPGAVFVFLDFISYSSGPLPEQQLEVGPAGGAGSQKLPRRSVACPASQPQAASASCVHRNGLQHPPLHHARSLALVPNCPPQEVTVPVSILWGEEDPWEKVEWGRQLAKHAAVQVRGGWVEN